MNLSNDQKIAFDYITKQRVGSVLVTGHAGCGKTFLAVEIIKSFLEKGGKVICLSPTHQAKLQFSQSLPSSIKVMTVASFLKVKPVKDEASGIMEFTQGYIGKEDIGQYNLIIVDECSMIGEEDLKELVKLNSRSLIVFTGDFNQLSPVKKKDGSEIFNSMKRFNLTEQHRNAGEVLKLCDTLRNRVVYPKENKEGITVHDTSAEFLMSMIENIKKNPNPYNISYLAFTNKAVREVRNFIHSELYGSDPYVVGQYLRLESRTEVGNRSEIVEILEVEPFTKRLFDEEVQFYSLKVENVFDGVRGRIDVASYEDQDAIEVKVQHLQQESYELWNKSKQNPKDLKKKEEWKAVREELNQVDTLTMVSSPFALTVHKSQGRSIPTVYLDTKNISAYGRDMKLKLMYVGASRTKDNLHTIRV